MHEEHGSWLNAIVHLLPEQWHGWVDLNVVTSWLIIALLDAPVLSEQFCSFVAAGVDCEVEWSAPFDVSHIDVGAVIE